MTIFNANPVKPTKIIHDITEIQENYHGFIVDLWGVLHNGVAAFPSALDALSRLREAGKRIMLLSNAPRRSAAVAARCEELGITRAHYDSVHTSGEACWGALKAWQHPFLTNAGKRIFALLAESDRPMMTGLDVEWVDQPRAADLFLNIGIRHPGDQIATYAALLDEAMQRSLPMVCVNPDLVVMRGVHREICAGTLALEYEKRGGEVLYFGKPHHDVYRTCLNYFSLPPHQILAIGDSFRTDITGANKQGIDSLLVCDGIEAADILNGAGEPDPTKLSAAAKAHNAFPTYAIRCLR